MIQGLETNRLFKTRHQVAIQAVLVLIFSTLGLLALQSATTVKVKEVSAEYHRLIELEAQQLSNDLDEARTLLTTFPFEKGTIAAVDAAVNGSNAALTERLAIIMQRHPKLLQIRYLDTQGHELIRINRFGDSWQAIPSDQLQDKSQRDYTLASQAQAVGDVYFSTIDFNREYGAVEQPLQATIRIAAKAIDSAGNKQGVFVLNQDLNPFLQQIKAVALGADIRAINTAGLDLIANEYVDLQANRPVAEETVVAYVTSHEQQPLLQIEIELPGQLRHTISRDIFAHWAGPYTGLALTFMLLVYWLVRQSLLYQREKWRVKKARDLALANAKTESARRDAYQLIQSNTNGVLVVDRHGMISSTNPALDRTFGYEPSELVGQQIDCLIPAPIQQQHQVYVTNILELKTPRLMASRPVFGVKKDGSSIPLEISLTPLSASDDMRIAATVVDISERYDSEAEVDRLKKQDLLTRLPNRAALYEYLGQLFEQSDQQKHLLVILDLDFFKQINDSNGHDIGDKLLIDVASRLQDFIDTNAYPSFLARICGDEFALIARDINHPDSINDLLDSLLALFDSPFSQQDNDIWLRISIGASLYPVDGNNPCMLMRNADSALTNAKQTGRAKWLLYRNEFTLSVQRNQKIANALRSAIRNNELSLVYQPQVDARHNKLVGLEALVRWHNQQLGWVSPAEFVPVAESSGLMVELGQWVLREVCQQGAQWQQQGFDFGKLAVNVSSVEIIKGQLIESLKTQLLSSGLNAKRLCIEITESAVMDDRRQMLNTLNQINALGVSLSIDDFGTGMSSLARLKTLPFDTLKVDRSFVSDIPADTNDMAICDAIINMAKSLNIDIVIEGVETQEQLEFMLSRQCDVIQGYYFSKPLTTKELAERYTEAIHS